jgi:hypothetical protein
MTDLARWTDLAARPESPWSERLALLAARVPERATVIDVGAGSRALRGMIPESCLYLPVDCVGQGIVYDFNGPEIAPRLRGDVVAMSGFLEYVDRPEVALTHAREWAPWLLLSYAPSDGHDVEARAASGWVNDLSREALLALLDRVGFGAEVFGEWRGQVLIEARRR